MSNNDVIARILQAGLRKGWTKPETISTAAGLDRSYLRKRIDTGGTPKLETLRKLADALEVEPSWLATGINPRPGTPAQILPDLSGPDVRSTGVSFDLTRMPKDIPVLGTAAASSTDTAAFVIDGQIDIVRRPPGLIGAKNVYALYVGGLSMHPRYRHGEMILVSADRPAAIGDDVIIQTQNFEGAPVYAFLKELVRRTEREIVVRQLNPESLVTFFVEQVIALHRVIPVREMLGG